MRNAIENRVHQGLSWLPLAALGAVMLLLTSAALRRIWGADFWWQWATGRLVASEGIPSTDVFSYTAEGSPWIELRWLYCWTLFRLTSWFGMPAAVLAKWAMLVASFWLVTRSVLRERSGRVAAAVVLTIAILASSQRFFVRPELVTYLFFALFVWVLHRWRQRGSRWLCALPLLQILWTNSHTTFVLGPCLVGLALVVTVGETLVGRGAPAAERSMARRRSLSLGLVLLLTAAACLVNPYGLRGAAFPLQLFAEIRGTAFKDAIGEFRSPFVFDQGYVAIAYYKALIALCLASIAINLKRIDWFWLLLALSQLYLSALAIRNLPLFCLAAIPLVIDNVQRSRLWSAASPARLVPVARAVVSIGVIALCAYNGWALATDRFHVRQNDTNQFGVGIATSRYPEAAVRFLDEHGLSGPVVHPMREGAYLIASGYRVFIDPRLEVYGEQRFVDYLEAFRDPRRWQQTIDRWGARVLLLDLRSTALRFVLRSPRWRLAHMDEVAAVFVPQDAVEVPSFDIGDAVARVRERLPVINPESRRAWWRRVRSPAPYESFGSLLLRLGRPADALPFLRDAAALAPDPRAALAAEATALERLGDEQAAQGALEGVLEHDRHDPGALLRLATLRARAGDNRSARELLKRLLDVEPQSAFGWALHGKVCAGLGDIDAAVDSMGRAIELEPEASVHRANLGRILLNAGRLSEAGAPLLEALELAPNDVAVLRDLAILEAERGAIDRAVEYIERAIELAPGDPQLQAIRRRLAAAG